MNLAGFARALSAAEIVLHYQPQVDLLTGEVVAVEALARWQHPHRGLLYPDQFIPFIEDNGLTYPLTVHVLDLAMAQARLRRAAGMPATRVAFNVCASDLLAPSFVDDVLAALGRHNLPASALTIELTETAATRDVEVAARTLDALGSMGVDVSIDDFGTGHSSLMYLQRPATNDRSGVLTHRISAVIVQSTIALAHGLGLRVVAEGVEDNETLLALRDLGCDAAQGFGLARPTAAFGLRAVVRGLEQRMRHVLRVDQTAAA